MRVNVTSAFAATDAVHELDRTSQVLLSFVAKIDSWTGGEWDYRAIALTSSTICLTLWYWNIERSRKGSLALHSFLHVIVVSLGAIACVYLDTYASEALTGMKEPLRSVLCGGGSRADALTSLHEIIPPIAMGYTVGDILEGLAQRKPEFVLHGTVMAAMIWFLCEIRMQQTLNSMLLMEFSTVFLDLTLATQLPAAVQIVSQVMFATSFLTIRLCIVPYLWFNFLSTYYRHEEESCLPSYFIQLVVVLGVFFHGLNVIWSFGLVKRIRRKVLGLDSMTNTTLD